MFVNSQIRILIRDQCYSKLCCSDLSVGGCSPKVSIPAITNVPCMHKCHIPLCYFLSWLHGDVQDFSVKPHFVLSLWQASKMTALDATKELLQTRAMGATNAMQFIETITEQSRVVEQEVEIGRVQRLLFAKQSPFIPHAQIDKWLPQFDQNHYGFKQRFQSLLFRGDSSTGKTSRGLALFGPSQTVKVSCQGLPEGCLPSIRHYDRSCHRAILWDEIRPDQILQNKEVFQSGPFVITLGQSACNQHAYRVWLYQVAHILCANAFATTVPEGLDSEADEEWLQTNLVVLSLPAGRKWYVETASSA